MAHNHQASRRKLRPAPIMNPQLIIFGSPRPRNDTDDSIKGWALYTWDGNPAHDPQLVKQLPTNETQIGAWEGIAERGAELFDVGIEILGDPLVGDVGRSHDALRASDTDQAVDVDVGPRKDEVLLGRTVQSDFEQPARRVIVVKAIDDILVGIDR